MEEIFRLCDTVSVLLDGRHLATEAATPPHDTRQAIPKMVGREVKQHNFANTAAGARRGSGGVENYSSPGKTLDWMFPPERGQIILGFAAWWERAGAR
jgi:ABC-type sugar transport system ATPase subunit